MRILELFAGTESLAKVARANGHEVITLDISAKHNPTICINILEWDHTVFPQDHFDYIHASVPCENYSVCRSTGGDRDLEQADALVKKTIEILGYFKTCWTIENPATSLLWNRSQFEHIAKTSYCRYEYPYRKNTWVANNFQLKLRSQCDGKCDQVIGSKHKEWAQRGTNLKRDGAADQCSHSIDQLHSIPSILCEEILEYVYFQNVEGGRTIYVER